MENLAVMEEYMEMYEDYYDEEWDNGSADGCGSCPENECTGHCMSCQYRDF